jgi:hypothetical protein
VADCPRVAFQANRLNRSQELPLRAGFLLSVAPFFS